MLLKLNKKKMKTLSLDKSTVPAKMTPQVAGGVDIDSSYASYGCPPKLISDGPECPGNLTSRAC
ncbi:hypothetical protein HG263_02365 [Pseudoalteromonas sp. JBTF-M23]|uniref:Uncharacterized protein n=1 Tax=Pseudoalteromonas caenipelagi TaxID=2726988 RepID=A0A849V9D8_9GAMM|nr:hypothetical protein [Pseudoalteromonas caenipelagi]NOU49390.1 hypothetical protein [Pseudoalteromonas caenipelagi]